MTRNFWYDRIHRLCEEYVVSLPEEELKEYTIAELEQWAMRRIHARSTSPVKLHLRSRNDLPAREASYEIIPGGRWLLKICDNLPVYFVDLDSSDLEEHLLFDPRNIDPLRISHGEPFGDRLWIGHQSPRLSFRIERCLVDQEGSLPFTLVYIYQVNLIGHGASAILEAQIIATFRRNTSTLWHAFNDHYFVSNSTAPTLGIFDYRQAMECFDYPLIGCYTRAHTLEYHPTEFEFINEDVLAVYYITPSFYRI
ncbi:hypothetical protein Agabi119p4_9919 [Agaricus bisporus var. burnettii]|uniref:Uncharacterized protein n=1 Tax=Agaricus bisporus var. burnettii TaxID=192524 RepID=A0A8H7C3Q1_AGABI|nr:hypothetical protein Agabi119p4_9919 [Agaricus bisporus var. burnettii]